jgi:succinyl-CoA synthetase alpha subunit
MSILVDEKTRLITQGITGREGMYHTEQSMKYGTRVVGGVTPGKGGQKVLENVPVFNTVRDAVVKTKANTTMVFVPPPFAADAILEAADAGIELIICITEGIPISDMVDVYKYLQGTESRLVGPNCPGVISPGKAKIGIMPAHIHKKGNVGIIW